MHSAVWLFDICLGKEEFAPERYQALIVVCLFIASKIEELEYNMPKARYYVNCSRLSAREFRAMEIEVCELLDWNLN
jgi:hypothetical protein